MSIGKQVSVTNVKRGDTIIEVVFAIAIFALVMVSSMSIMNLGIAHAQNALEVSTARSEINAQAEALRFIHSSYIAERSLPISRQNADGTINERYQQYRELWDTITSDDHVLTAQEAQEKGLYDYVSEINNSRPGQQNGCIRLYNQSETGKSMLQDFKAFILNTRNMSSKYPRTSKADIGITYLSALDFTNNDVFREAPLNARVVFGRYNASASDEDSSTEYTDRDTAYRYVKYAEGIWVAAVKSDQTAHRNGSDTGRPEYFDFYIQSCWYGLDSTTPTTIDTAIRLYNPENF